MIVSDNLMEIVNEKNDRAEYQSALDLILPVLNEHKTDYALWIGAGNAYYGLRRFKEAEQAYLKAASLPSTDVVALANLVGVYFETARFKEGLAVCDQALAERPDDFNVLVHKGNILSSLDRHGEAIDFYQKALKVSPNDLLVLFNLANALAATGQTDSAEEIYRRLLAVSPNDAEYLYAYAVFLESKEDFVRAAKTYLRLLQIKENATTHVTLSGCLYNLQLKGETDRVLYLTDEWLSLFPDNPIAEHMLETLKGSNDLKRASAAYVQELFDAFADSFDSVLNGLEYQAPSLIATAVKKISFDRPPSILDLGCGTGLCAAAMKEAGLCFSSLAGVDLSAEMLKKADQRQLYAALYQDDIVSFLPSCPSRFDLAVSADVFTYMGDLSKVFSGLSIAVKSGGRIVFTVSENTEGVGYALEPSGRFMHSKEYVINELRSNFDIEEIQSVTLRQELGKPVAGLLIVGKKI